MFPLYQMKSAGNQTDSKIKEMLEKKIVCARNVNLMKLQMQK